MKKAALPDKKGYFGDFGGMLWALNADTGGVIWSRRVSDYTGIAGDIARTSPSVAGNTLVVGGLRGPNMLGINAQTGELRWLTQVHPDARGIMTGSPVLAGDTIYTPPGEWHWHGAAPDHFMSHLAMWEAPLEGPESEWGDQVSDEEYARSA